jgi:tRNA(Ile)-lysidine synthetase-like protein
MLPRITPPSPTGYQAREWGEGGKGGEGRQDILLDARAIPDGAQLVVRPARAGERIAPLGMGGRTRLIRDVMADAGWPAALRAVAPVLFAARADGAEEETALWVVGLAQAEATRVTDETPAVVELSARWEC